MAGSLIAEDIMQDLTECSICLSLIEEPKALPCLHTFCLTCIQGWVKENTAHITCPLCQERCPIPPEGVHSLKTNFFITKLKETRLIQEKLNQAMVPCTCCGESGVEAEARCLDCKDFLCDKCVEMHKTLRPLKGHRVCSLDDLRAGKVTTTSNQEYCRKHDGQVMWFYCQTCQQPICRDCTVVDHPSTSHQHTDLETMVKSQKTEIQLLASQCHKVASQVDMCIKQADNMSAELERALDQGSKDLQSFTQETKTKIIASIEKSHSALMDEFSQIQQDRRTEIMTQKQSLIMQQSKLRTALETANRVAQIGSQSDIASLHGTLSATMKQMLDSAPEPLPGNLSKLKFRPNKLCQPKALNLGTFSTKVSHESQGSWTIKKKFGIDGPGMLLTALDIAVGLNGDVAVADNDKAQVKVYTKAGQYKFSLDTKQGLKPGTSSYPRGVTVSQDGHFFITDGTQYVKVYDTQSRYLYHFAAISSNGTPSDLVPARLAGIAINFKGELLVGEVTQKYISRHDPNSCHLSSIKVDIDPNFIAAAPQGGIIVSSCDQNTVLLLDDSGRLLHSLAPPSELTTWYPSGVCCSPDQEEIFVASQAKGNAAIYRYTLTGEYIGCVTKTVDNPCGLVFAEEDKLLVADWNAASCFLLQ